MKQDQKFKKIRAVARFENQSGQAAVEYVLLLVVIVSMVIAAKGLFQGADQFINAYVGDYFKCLMDHGELPKQNVSEEDLKKHVSSSYKCGATFSIATGANLTSKIGSDKNGADKNGAESGKNQKKSNQNNKSSSENNDSSGGGGSGSTSAYNDGRIQKSNSGGKTSDGRNSITTANKSKIIEGEPDAESSFGNNNNMSGGANRTVFKISKYKAIDGGPMYEAIQKNSKNQGNQTGLKSISKIAIEEGSRPGPRKNALTPPPERKPAATEDVAPDFGLGGFMKWLLIAGMVVAIIVFFGGQIMNYSNSE